MTHTKSRFLSLSSVAAIAPVVNTRHGYSRVESRSDSYSSCGANCPRCTSPVFRVSRRFIDLLVSVFVPIRRYRCISMACSWEGNLREKQSPLPNIARTSL